MAPSSSCEACKREKRALVTGGPGLIGCSLARRLVGLGAQVALVDSLIPEYGGNLFNIPGIEDKVRVHISDVRDERSVKYLVQGQDLLFNLAGQTSHVASMQNSFTDLDVNAKSQLYIPEACRRRNPDIKVVFSGTRHDDVRAYSKPAGF